MGAQGKRGVAQPGSAPEWGSGGRRFKSSLPDHSSHDFLTCEAIVDQSPDPSSTITGIPLSSDLWIASNALTTPVTRRAEVRGSMPALMQWVKCSSACLNDP
jgi:hypothetical protein